MVRPLFYCLIFCAYCLSSCSTASNLSKSGYEGIYQNPQNPLERFVITYRNDLYYLKYHAADQQEWEGVGFENDGHILAVIQASDEEREGRFLKISFPGENRLFVVTRNVEGGYLNDQYYQQESNSN